MSVEPNGDIAVCRELVIGNAARQDIMDIFKHYDPDSVAEHKAILRGGVAALADLARERQMNVTPDGYYSICDICISLRRQLKNREQK